MPTQTEIRLERRVNERANVHAAHEQLLKDAGENDLTDAQKTEAVALRERAVELDTEIDELEASVSADKAADERARAVRRAMAGRVEGVDADDDGVVYRTMAAYARDVILTGQGREVSKIAANVAKPDREAAAQRLELAMRSPANTLTSDVAGLLPPQHIAQIFQVIDTSRPIVQSAQRAALERGVLTYPQVDASPVVAVWGTEKTAAFLARANGCATVARMDFPKTSITKTAWRDCIAPGKDVTLYRVNGGGHQIYGRRGAIASLMRTWGPDISAAETIMAAFVKETPAPTRKERIGARRAAGSF